jgi:aquaporin Z
MKKYLAEMCGTFVLVFVGCGTAALSTGAGTLGIALAFGLALVAMAYAIGPVSGCHINPAVTLGSLCAGRMSLKDALGYIIFQFIGALIAAWVLTLIVAGRGVPYDVSTMGLGQNGWGPGYGGGYSMEAALIFELIASYIFIKVILAVTKEEQKIAGLVIGLTLAVLLMLGMDITGGSLNPARSFGPAFFVCGKAMCQVWLFLAVPAVAGILAGLCDRCPCSSCKKEVKKAPAPKAAAKTSKKK